MMSKDRFLCFFYISLLFSWDLAKATSCIQDFCTCDDESIFCLDVVTPSFIYRPTVTRLYMERVQLLNMQNIFASLPSLDYLTLVDMLYFNCDWLKDIPKQIKLMGNMCQTELESSSARVGE